MEDRRLDIVPMEEGDLDHVLAIQRESHLSSWPRQIFLDEFERDWAYLDVLREPREDGGSRIVGFCNYWLVQDEVHLLNIATHPDERRRGLARRLMDHLLEFARQHECHFVILEVRKSNDVAIELYRSYGFRTVGIRPRYYVEDREDAVVMTLEL